MRRAGCRFRANKCQMPSRKMEKELKRAGEQEGRRGKHSLESNTTRDSQVGKKKASARLAVLGEDRTT